MGTILLAQVKAEVALASAFPILAQVPPIGPNIVNNPATPYGIRVINLFLGILVIVFAFVFFVCLAKLVSSFMGKGKDDKSPGAAVAGMGIAVAGIVVVFAGAAFLNGWVNVVSG